MSYNFAIVNFDVPSSFQKASEMIDPLCDVEVDQPDPVFIEFVERVTQIYPCICDLEDHEIDEKGVWSDGPLIDNFKVKAPVVGMVYSEAEKAYPTVEKLALSMGLTIIDWQAEKVIKPSFLGNLKRKLFSQ